MRLTEFSSCVSSKQWAAALALFLTVFLAGESGFAARVTQVKGNQVLVDLEGEDANAIIGKRFIVMVGDKRRAIVEITKAKKQKAIGKVLKGKPSVDGTLVALTKSSAKKKRSSGTSEEGEASSPAGPTDTTYGVLVGMNMANQSVTTGGKTYAMTGNGFSLKAFGDFVFMDDLSVVGRAGLEQFSVTGSSKKTDLMYIVGDLLLKYRFMTGSFQPFVEGGLGIHYPISKSSDAIDTDLLSFSTVIILGGGANYAISDTTYITGMLEYGYFPPSSDVTTSWIAFRGGVGMKF